MTGPNRHLPSGVYPFGYGTPPVDEPAEPRRRLADRVLDEGAKVAQQYAGQDRWEPDRAPLSVLIAQSLADAERRGEERARAEADARYSALLDRVAGVIRQRQDLAVERERVADRRRAEGKVESKFAEDRWAAELRSQVDAIRCVLDDAEQAEVTRRVEQLRQEQP